MIAFASGSRCAGSSVGWYFSRTGFGQGRLPAATRLVRSSSTSFSFFGETETDKRFPTEASIVIGGGGIIGCSVAYHLAKAGFKNVLLLEQGRLACGSTWTGSAVVGSLKSSMAEVDLISHSLKLYKELHEEGIDIGFKQIGSINLCRTDDRVLLYKRNQLVTERFGLRGEFLSPNEIKNRVPILNTADILGGMWMADDCVVNPTKLTIALAKKAKELGVEIIEKCQISRILTSGDSVTSVQTDNGYIQCGIFVNCAGMWARKLGQHSEPRVRVPLHACEMTELITKPLTGVDLSRMPAIRDYDGRIYLREWNGGILSGGYQSIAKPVFHDGIPADFEFQLLPEDWDNYHGLMEQVLHRVPSLVDVEVQQLKCGAESFTPDGKYVMGRVPEVFNYFVAAGMNSTGVAAAGGIGKYLTEWIYDGTPSINTWSFDVIDTWAFDVQRFADLHNNKKFLRDRVTESLGAVAQIPYWEADMIGWDTGRRLRTSAIFTRNEPYAVFGQNMGYERPLYFHSSSQVDEDSENVWTMPKPVASVHGIKAYALHETGLPQKGTFGKPAWFDNVKAEYWACREGVCLIDMSTFAKFELRSAGHEVVQFLQHVCSNDVDKAVGSIVHTGIQNHEGGYENDCSVIRLEHNRYFMIGPTAQTTRSLAWLRDHLPKDGTVQLNDVTSMYTAINVIGPKAEELLAQLTDTPLGKREFMHMTYKEMHVGMASNIKAVRLTHTGEDGFTLYIPTEFALHVHDCLVTAGKNYGLHNAGYYALRALRTEKFFAYWGADLLPNSTPLECGREYRVKFDIGGFIGYPALMKQKNEGIRKKLVLFLMDDHNVDEDPWPWSGEPIYRNGVYCGMTTSTAYGFGLDRHICLGYVQDFDKTTREANIIGNDFVLKNAKFQINVGGRMYPAKANIYPPLLPSPSAPIVQARE